MAISSKLINEVNTIPIYIDHNFFSGVTEADQLLNSHRKINKEG